jgi:hypothetical protein
MVSGLPPLVPAGTSSFSPKVAMNRIAHFAATLILAMIAAAR